MCLAVTCGTLRVLPDAPYRVPWRVAKAHLRRPLIIGKRSCHPNQVPSVSAHVPLALRSDISSLLDTPREQLSRVGLLASTADLETAPFVRVRSRADLAPMADGDSVQDRFSL